MDTSEEVSKIFPQGRASSFLDDTQDTFGMENVLVKETLSKHKPLKSHRVYSAF